MVVGEVRFVIDGSADKRHQGELLARNLSAGLGDLADGGVQVTVDRPDGAGLSREPSGLGRLIFRLDSKGVRKGGGLTVSVTGFPPDLFAPLGLCYWRQKPRGELAAECHYAWTCLPSSEGVESLLFVVLGIDCLLRSSFREAVGWLDSAVALGAWGLHGLWWLALAHLGVGGDTGERDHFTRGIELLDRAIARAATELDGAISLASMRRALARAWCQRSGSDPIGDCRAALAELKKAGAAIDERTYPLERSGLLYDRASVQVYMPKGHEADAIRSALQDAEQALAGVDSEQFPAQYAMCMNALGRIHSEWHTSGRLGHQRTAYLCYVRALAIRTRARSAWEYGQTQHNLGVLYLQRLEGDDRSNLLRARQCLEEALSVFDRERFPYRHAHSLAALGRAEMRLKASRRDGDGDPIQRFRDVLSIATPIDMPYLHGRTRHDLGNAITADPADNSFDPAAAVFHFKRALEIFSTDCFPADRARVLVDVGRVYLLYAQPQGKELITEALASFQEALQLFGSAFPYESGCVHSMMALTYRCMANGSSLAGRLAGYHQERADAQLANEELALGS